MERRCECGNFFDLRECSGICPECNKYIFNQSTQDNNVSKKPNNLSMSNTSKAQPVKILFAKKRNRRIQITFCKQNNDYYFIVKTKRLQDFKKRQIVTTEVIYGIESFVVLQELFKITIDDVDVAKRINKSLGFSKYNLDIHAHPEIDKY